MTKDEAVKIVHTLVARYPTIRVTEDNRDAYVAAIVKLHNAARTYRAVVEIAETEQRLPSVPRLMYLIRQAEATSKAGADNAPTYTGRATLKISDVCIHCGRRITDQEFEEDNWRLVENGRDEVVGREHRCCHPKREAAHTEAPDRVPDDMQPAQFAADIPF